MRRFMGTTKKDLHQEVYGHNNEDGPNKEGSLAIPYTVPLGAQAPMCVCVYTVLQKAHNLKRVQGWAHNLSTSYL